jgi:hypothetical protein
MKTYEGYIDHLANAPKEKEIRQGQHIINTLFYYDDTAYKHIMASEADCFYDDEKIEDFWRTLTKYYS